MSPRTIGVDAKAPNELVPVSAKRHLTFSLATVRALIVVRVVARVLARSWLWAGQAPAFVAHSGGGRPAAVSAGAVGEMSAGPPRASATARAVRQSGLRT